MLGRMTQVASGVIVVLVVWGTSGLAVAELEPPKGIDTDVATAKVFRYRFKAREISRYALSVSQRIDVSGTTSTQTGSTITAALLRATLSVGLDGGAKVRTVYEHPKFQVSRDGVTLPEADTDAMNKALSQVARNQKLTPRGEVSNVEIEGLGELALQLSESLDSATIGLFPVFPEEALVAGGSWIRRVPLELVQGGLNLKVTFELTYVFLGFIHRDGHPLAVFRVKINTKLDETPSITEAGMFSMKGGGHGVAYAVFDASGGALVSSEMELTQRSKMHVAVAGQPPQTYAMTQITRTSLTR